MERIARSKRMPHPLDLLTSTSLLSTQKKALAAAAEGRASYLTARLRPGDPLSHPLVSSAVRGGETGGSEGRRGLLLRVAKREEVEEEQRREAAEGNEQGG